MRKKENGRYGRLLAVLWILCLCCGAALAVGPTASAEVTNAFSVTVVDLDGNATGTALAWDWENPIMAYDDQAAIWYREI